MIPGSGRSPGGGHGNPLQYSCLENPMDRGAWWAAVHGVTESEHACTQDLTNRHSGWGTGSSSLPTPPLTPPPRAAHSRGFSYFFTTFGFLKKENKANLYSFIECTAGLWDLSSSTRDRTWALVCGSEESQPQDPPGIPETVHMKVVGGIPWWSSG